MAFGTEQSTRRTFLAGMITLPALAGLLTAAASADASKASKAAMHYQDTPNGNSSCSGCKYFVAGQSGVGQRLVSDRRRRDLSHRVLHGVYGQVNSAEPDRHKRRGRRRARRETSSHALARLSSSAGYNRNPSRQYRRHTASRRWRRLPELRSSGRSGDLSQWQACSDRRFKRRLGRIPLGYVAGLG